MRSIPVHDDLWEAAKSRASHDGRPLRTIIRELIRGYADGEITPPSEPDSSPSPARQ